MRIGLYGGTFDPVHLGHLRVAEQACLELGLQRIFFVLTPNPPHKAARAISPAPQRLRMLQLAAADHPQFEVSTAELERGGVSYTVDTLRHFRAQPEFAGAELFLIIGADSLLELKNWREPQTIISMAQLAVYSRSGLDWRQAAPQFLQAAHLLSGPPLDISATDIRQRCSRGESIRDLVPEPVRNYILENKLYQNSFQKSLAF